MLRVPNNNKSVRYILNNLRSEDKKEVYAKYGKKHWKKKVFKDLKNLHFTVLIDKRNKKPIAMGGACAVDKNNSDFAVVWLLSTLHIKNKKVALLKIIKEEFESYDEKYFMTGNFIYKKNYMMKSFLKKLGCNFIVTPQCQKDFEYFYRVNKKIRGLS